MVIIRVRFKVRVGVRQLVRASMYVFIKSLHGVSVMVYAMVHPMRVCACVFLTCTHTGCVL